jgi:hypothetical protein
MQVIVAVRERKQLLEYHTSIGVTGPRSRRIEQPMLDQPSSNVTRT